MALFAQWARFRRERDFSRYAQHHRSPAFPTLPARSQDNRLLRQAQGALVAVSHWLAQHLTRQPCAYEVLESTGVPTRNAQRRGSGGLAGHTAIGWCNRLGWDEGFHLLVAVTPTGVRSGSGFAPATAADQRLAETLLAVRASPPPRLPEVGQALGESSSLVDTGFEGHAGIPHWRRDSGASVLCPPKPSHPPARPAPERRWLAGVRQIVETVNSCLLSVFGLAQERPHALDGFRAVGRPGGVAEFLLLAQPAARPAAAGLCRFDRLVT